METKPYNLQSPEQIAKDYGGNKQKIAEGMQMGIIDPTAGTLAGMFIDRMRSAAQQEQAPQQSVAQQVFAPPAPPAPMGGPPMGGPPMGGPPAPAGLGATPEAAQMPPMPGMGGPPPGAPPMGAPPMGAPPMGGPPPGPEAPPMGMAEGGMVPPYMAGGGLSDLPLPDDMFDEPRDGGYANGGIVAFADSGLVGTDGVEKPDSMYGYSSDPTALVEEYRKLYSPKSEYSNQQAQFYKDTLSPESIKKSKQEDMWMALGQIGAKMANTRGSLLQAASAGIEGALPGIRETAKERKAEQRDAIRQLALNEGASNVEARREADLYMQGKGKYAELKSASETERRREGLTREEIASRERISGNQIAAEKLIAGMRQPNESDLDAMLRIMTTGTPAQKAGLKEVLKLKQDFAPAALMDPVQAALLARMNGGRGGGGTNTPTRVEWK